MNCLRPPAPESPAAMPELAAYKPESKSWRSIAETAVETVRPAKNVEFCMNADCCRETGHVGKCAPYPAPVCPACSQFLNEEDAAAGCTTCSECFLDERLPGWREAMQVAR